MNKEISPEALAVLKSAEKLPDCVRLTSGQLDKHVYREVADVVEVLGGKWNTRAQAFLFKKHYIASLEALLRGEAPLPKRNPMAFFPTPETFAVAVVGNSQGFQNLASGAKVIEPSAGRAALILALRAIRDDLTVDACEIDPENRAILSTLGVNVVAEDFLTLPDEPVYDGALLNPPFSVPGDKFAWASHVEKIRRITKPNAVIVAILPLALMENGYRRIVDLREYFERVGTIVRNPDGAFFESGTATKTVTVYVGGTCAAVTAHPPAIPAPTSDNVYWRDWTGPVVETKNVFLTPSGAVLYWTGAESEIAQSSLRVAAQRSLPTARVEAMHCGRAAKPNRERVAA
jgi:hypothetical protein